MQTGTTKELSVAIVGLGSRGLSLFERLVTLAGRGERLRIDLVDPSCTGTGLHVTDQPDYLLLNTTCGQVSMFPDEHTLDGDEGEPGPSLYEWASERGLRLAEDGFSTGSEGRELRPTDFLPRRLLGEYLCWFRRRVEARAAAGVRVREHRSAALDLARDGDGNFRLRLADGSELAVRYVFLTLGHADNAASDTARPGAERMIRQPYPLPAALRRVGGGETLALAGFGLSAMDVMAACTFGRGGRFVDRGGHLRYLASGDEPRLLFFSRCGVPFRARPQVCSFERVHSPLVFTQRRLDEVRAAAGGRLDFDRDVKPLIVDELRVAYRLCEAGRTGDEAERALGRRLAAAARLGELGRMLDELDARLGRFDAAAAWHGGDGMRLDDGAAYQAWLADAVARDLGEAVLGTGRSALKASLDVLRQQRDTVRYAVDYGGLTDASLDAFMERTVAAMNRAVVGPQFERHEELLALLEAGVAEVPLGPAPEVAWNAEAGTWTLTSTALRRPCRRSADWLCFGRVPAPAVETSANPLVRALHGRGWLRPMLPGSRTVRGAEVDPDQHPVDARGRPVERLWLIGPLCEGATFYNHLVPSPRTWSRPIADAHRCVAELYADARGVEPSSLVVAR